MSISTQPPGCQCGPDTPFYACSCDAALEIEREEDARSCSPMQELHREEYEGVDFDPHRAEITSCQSLDLHVVVFHLPVYGRSTDAYLGDRRLMVGAFLDYADAERFVERENDRAEELGEESVDFRILAPSRRRPALTEFTDDEDDIPF